MTDAWNDAVSNAWNDDVSHVSSCYAAYGSGEFHVTFLVFTMSFCRSLSLLQYGYAFVFLNWVITKVLLIEMKFYQALELLSKIRFLREVELVLLDVLWLFLSL